MDRFGSTLSPYLQGNRPSRLPGQSMGIEQLLQRDSPPTPNDVRMLLPFIRPDLISSLLQLSHPQAGGLPSMLGQQSRGNSIFQQLRQMDLQNASATKKYAGLVEQMRKMEMGELPGQGGQSKAQGGQARPGMPPKGRPGGGRSAGQGPGQVIGSNPAVPTYGGRRPAMGQIGVGPQARAGGAAQEPTGIMGLGQGSNDTMQRANNTLVSLLQGAGGAGQRAGGQYLPDIETQAAGGDVNQFLYQAMNNPELRRLLPTDSLAAIINGGMV